MINGITPVRNSYYIRMEEYKNNNMPLNNSDYLNIGYMAGRFGINLANPNEANNIYRDENGLYVNINSCCSDLFEASLNQSGIKFNRIV